MSLYKGNNLISGAIPNSANQSLSNLDSTGQDIIDGKVSKSGDTMSGRLHFASNSITDLRETFKFEDIILGTVPSETHFSGFQTFDSQDYEFANILCSYNSDGRICANFYVRKPISGGSVSGNMGVYINAQNEVYCTFPHTDCVDGQWVYKNTSLGSNVKWDTSSHKNAKDYSLANYLPQDNYNYEVILRASVATGATSGNYVTVGVSSDILTAQHYVCQAQTRASASVGGRGEVIVIVGPARKITVAGASSGANGTYTMAVTGYKRMGTNS